jgi:hypothetical protein
MILLKIIPYIRYEILHFTLFYFIFFLIPTVSYWACPTWYVSSVTPLSPTIKILKKKKLLYNWIIFLDQSRWWGVPKVASMDGEWRSSRFKLIIICCCSVHFDLLLSLKKYSYERTFFIKLIFWYGNHKWLGT